MIPQQKLFQIVEDIVEAQAKKVLKTGREFVPRLTLEDVLQPCDYPELEFNPHFRYEEGVLEGVLTVKAALFALCKEETQVVQ